MAENKNKPELTEAVPPPSKETLAKAGLNIQSTKDGQPVLMPSHLPTPDELQKDMAQMANKMALQGGGRIDTSNFYNLFQFFSQSVLETKTKERMKRYDQMDYIFENDAALTMVRSVLVDELIQADMFKEPLTIIAKKKSVRLAIERLFKTLGVKHQLATTANNIISYGDAFQIMDIDPKRGVTKLIPIDVRDVRHRFQFSIAELRKSKNRYTNQFPTLHKFITMLSDVSSSASDFNNILLGFQVMDSFFPFWQMLHYRVFTTRQNIAPFGKPFFYESQSEARMYLNSKVIVNMIRASSFIKEYYKIKTGEQDDPVSQWAQLSTAKQMLEMFNQLGGKGVRDYPSMGDRVYLPDGLVEVEVKDAGINLRDRYEDLEMQRQDVFTSTGLPKDFFMGGGGTYVNNKNLISQDKKSARKVFNLQTVIIEQLHRLVETHFSYTKEFDPTKEEFAISLPYPVPDMDEDLLNSKSAKTNFAVSTMDQLKTALNITRVPTDVVVKMLRKYFPLDDEEIESITKQVDDDQRAERKLGFSRLGLQAGDPFLQNKISQDLTIQNLALMPQQTKAAIAQAKLGVAQTKMQVDQMKGQADQAAQAGPVDPAAQAPAPDPAAPQPYDQSLIQQDDQGNFFVTGGNGQPIYVDAQGLPLEPKPSAQKVAPELIPTIAPDANGQYFVQDEEGTVTYCDPLGFILFPQPAQPQADQATESTSPDVRAMLTEMPELGLQPHLDRMILTEDYTRFGSPQAYLEHLKALDVQRATMEAISDLKAKAIDRLVEDDTKSKLHGATQSGQLDEIARLTYDRSLLEAAGDDFAFQGRHFVTNDFTSTERNSEFIMDGGASYKPTDREELQESRVSGDKVKKGDTPKFKVVEGQGQPDYRRMSRSERRKAEAAKGIL